MDNVLITIYGTQKKTTTNIGEEKSTITEIQNNPPVPSITPLFNLLALPNKFKSEISSDDVCVFFSSIFYLYCITFIYLHLYLKSVYLS
jgi:hypothetical protein